MAEMKLFRITSTHAYKSINCSKEDEVGGTENAYLEEASSELEKCESRHTHTHLSISLASQHWRKKHRRRKGKLVFQYRGGHLLGDLEEDAHDVLRRTFVMQPKLF